MSGIPEVSNFLIAIPSRGRVLSLGRTTVNFIPEVLHENTVVFTTMEEEKIYGHAMQMLQMPKIRVVGLEYDGIADKRHKIGQWAKQNGYEKFCMVDDDIYAFNVRVGLEATNLRRCAPQDMVQMFLYVWRYLDWYRHGGVSARFMNQSFNGDFPIVGENHRAYRFLAFGVDYFLSLEHGKMKFYEDMDYTLQGLTKGTKNFVLYAWSQDQVAMGNIGGCSLYRTLEAHNAEVYKFAARWPSFVSVVEKMNKSGSAIDGGMANRLEARVNWKAAFAFGSQQKTS